MIAGMAEGVELALGTMMFYGLADWVYKRAAASGVQPHHFLLLQAFFFAPGIFLYGLTTGTLVLGVPFAWGMTAGVLVFVALYNFARSLARPLKRMKTSTAMAQYRTPKYQRVAFEHIDGPNNVVNSRRRVCHFMLQQMVENAIEVIRDLRRQLDARHA